MNETTHATSIVPLLSSPLEALRTRIEREAPHLHVLTLCDASPRPFLQVKDTVHRIVVSFSSEEEYTLYRQVVERDSQGGA